MLTPWTKKTPRQHFVDGEQKPAFKILCVEDVVDVL